MGLPSLAIDITRGCRNFSQLRIESTAVKLLTVLPSQSVLPATSTVLAIDMLELEDMTHLPGVCVPFIPTLCSRCNLTYFARNCPPHTSHTPNGGGGVLCVREERTCVLVSCTNATANTFLFHTLTHSHLLPIQVVMLTRTFLKIFSLISMVESAR